MKNIALTIASVFLLSTAVLAGEGKVAKRSHSKAMNTNAQLTEKISDMLGYPSNILDGEHQSVMISYAVDENNVIHVQEISTSNTDLKKYIEKRMEGKKLKNINMQGKNGVMKVQFNAAKKQKLHFQY